jgi:hypothetical protein
VCLSNTQSLNLPLLNGDTRIIISVPGLLLRALHVFVHLILTIYELGYCYPFPQMKLRLRIINYPSWEAAWLLSLRMWFHPCVHMENTQSMLTVLLLFSDYKSFWKEQESVEGTNRK